MRDKLIIAAIIAIVLVPPIMLVCVPVPVKHVSNRMTTWFTSDPHFFHDNVIKYCPKTRGHFNDVVEMSCTIAENWNRLVKPSDTIYCLGDVMFGEVNETSIGFIKQLHGRKLLVPGNHDFHKLKALSKLFELQLPLKDIVIEGQSITLCHYAMRTWNKSHYGAWQLYGHSHGNLPPIGKQVDVGVDQWDMCPVSFEQLKSHFA
jgi:calcineurin-like phosphoesterase family protein